MKGGLSHADPNSMGRVTYGLITLAFVLLACRGGAKNPSVPIDGYYALSAEFPSSRKTPVRIRGDVVLRRNADSSFSGQYWLGDPAAKVGLATEGSLSGIVVHDGDLEFFMGSKSLSVRAKSAAPGLWKGDLKSEEFGSATTGRISLARARDLHGGYGLFELSYVSGDKLKSGIYTGLLRVEDTAPSNLDISGELRQYERDSASGSAYLLLRRIPVNTAAQIDPTGRVSFTMPFIGGVICTTSEWASSGAVGNCTFGSIASNRIQFDFVKIPSRASVMSYPIKSDTLFDAETPEWTGADLIGTLVPKRGDLFWVWINSDSLRRVGAGSYARFFTYGDEYLSVDSIAGINQIDRLLVSGADTFATSGRLILRVQNKAAAVVFEASKNLGIWKPVKGSSGFWFTDGESLFHLTSAGVVRDPSPWLAKRQKPEYGGLSVLKDGRVWLILRDTSSNANQSARWYSAIRDQRGIWTTTHLPNSLSKDKYVFLTADSSGFYSTTEICPAGTDTTHCSDSRRRTVVNRLSPQLEFSVDTLSLAVGDREWGGNGPIFGRTYDGLALLRFDTPTHVQDTLFAIKRPPDLTPAVQIRWLVPDRKGGVFALLSNDLVLHFH